MTARNPPATTRRVHAALDDIHHIQTQLTWLANHLPDLDTIAHSRPWQPTEHTHTHTHTTTSPNLADQGDTQLRQHIQNTCRHLKAIRIQLRADHQTLANTLNGPPPSTTEHDSDLDGDELRRLRAAKTRRDNHAGDPRWGEWEATPATPQPNQGRNG